MNYKHLVLATLSTMTLVSCGGSGGGSKSSQNKPQQEMQSSEGNYKAILRPYNFQVSGWIPNGMTDIKIAGNTIEIRSWLDDSAAVTHMQNIHLGTVCPEARHDANKDGYVDFDESTKVSGQPLLALDSDIERSDEMSLFPKGNFTYFQKASLEKISQELETNFNIEGKVIIVMGSSNKTLPATISSVNGQSRELSVPIACGVIQRMDQTANL